MKSIEQKKQTFKLPTVTQNGLSTPMKELIDRHQKGIPLGVGQRVPTFGKAGKEFQTLDLVEIQDMRVENEVKIKKLQTEAKQEIADKKEAAKQKEIQEAIAKAKAEEAAKGENPQ